MIKNLLRVIAGLAVVGAICFYIFSFQVQEGRMAVVTRFGKPVKVVTNAGLYSKLPWPFEKANIIDARSRVFNTRQTEMLTRDKRNTILLSYIVWSVKDPPRFFQSIGTTIAALLIVCSRR
mgnify:FL=1